MIAVQLDSKQFMKDMNNIVAYSQGFLDGVERARPIMLDSLGEELKLMVGEFIDSSASTNPASLHHIYEWYQTGSPAARLFDIDYVVSDTGLTFSGTLSQSKSVKNGSREPFYNKAKIMEAGNSVVITPRDGGVLAFESDGKKIFTKKSVTVKEPGGTAVEGSFHDTFKQFFLAYLSQSLMDVSGVMQNLSNPIDFKKNLSAGKSGGRSTGLATGMKWASKGALL